MKTTALFCYLGLFLIFAGALVKSGYMLLAGIGLILGTLCLAIAVIVWKMLFRGT